MVLRIRVAGGYQISYVKVVLEWFERAVDPPNVTSASGPILFKTAVGVFSSRNNLSGSKAAFKSMKYLAPRRIRVGEKIIVKIV